jgi:hypothetical protein
VPVGQTVQTQEPADPPALGAAAGIERLGERRGLPGVQPENRPDKRCRRTVFDLCDSEGEDDPEGDVDIDCAPPHENQDDTSRDAQGVSGGNMDGVSAPPPAFQEAACSAKPTSDAEADGLRADAACHCLDLICGYGDSNRSSPHGLLLEAELVLNKAIDAGVGKDSKAAEAGPVTPASGSSVSPVMAPAAGRSGPVMAPAADHGAGSRHRPSCGRRRPPSLERRAPVAVPAPSTGRGAGLPSSGQPLYRPHMCRSWSVQMLGERARVSEMQTAGYIIS